MKLVCGLGATLLATSAFAADLHKAPYAPSTPSPQPVPQWTGFYAGFQVGYGFDPSIVVPGATPQGFTNVIQTTSAGAPNGVTAGGRIGYDWQTGGAVWGVEADLSWSAIQRDGYLTLNADPIQHGAGGSNTTWHEAIDWWGSANVRLGMPVLNNMALIYVLGGVAFGNPNTNVTFNVTNPTTSGSTSGSFGGTQVGWDVGGGIAVKLTPASEIFAEARWVDLGTISNELNLTLPLGRNTAIYNTNASQAFGFAVGQVGYAYHF